MALSRVSSCLISTNGLTAAEKQVLKARAAEYNTGDSTQDYVSAVRDTLAELRTVRERVVAAIKAAQAKAVEAAKPPPAPAPTEAELAAALAEAEARDKAEAAAKAALAKRSEFAREAIFGVESIENTPAKERITVAGQKMYVKQLKYLLDLLDTATHHDIEHGSVDYILNFLSTRPVNALFREAITEFAKDAGVIRGQIVSPKAKTTRVNPAFTVIVNSGMVEDVRKVAAYKNLPAEFVKGTPPGPEQQARDAATGTEAEIEAREAQAKAEANRNPTAAAEKLALAINDFNKFTGRRNEKQLATAVQKLKTLWAAVIAEGTDDYDADGTLLSEYFNERDEPIISKIDGMYRVATEVASAETRSKIEAALAKADEKDPDAYDVRNELSDWEFNGFGRSNMSEEADPTTGYERAETADEVVARETEAAKAERKARTKEVLSELAAVGRAMGLKVPKGRYFRDDGTPLTETVPAGRIRIMVGNFLSKLRVKPTVHIYKSQADLKERNPALYARAAKERPNGDFDTASAVGYSFGKGEVIIFTDRVATEKQLHFVLAHETLGHFGFSAIMPDGDLQNVMNMVYESSPRIKAAVDVAMQVHGMSKAEAVEEYLADFAGSLDTNILARFWDHIKSFLNKLGVTFDDDMARYVVSQSRAYVRNGATDGKFFDVVKIAQRWHAIETVQDPDGTGRFAQSGPWYDDQNVIAADYVSNRRDPEWNAAGLMQRAKDSLTNKEDLWDRVLGDLRTMNWSARENLGYRRLYSILRDTVHEAAKLRSKYNAMMHTILSPASEIGGTTIWGKGKAVVSQINTTNKMLNITSRVKMHGVSDAELAKVGPLFDFVNGEAKLNEETLRKLQVMGRITLKEFRDGFTYQITRVRAMTPQDRAAITAERDAALAKETDADKQKEISKEYAERLADNSVTYQETVKYDPKKYGTDKLTENSLEWKMYNEVRDTMDASATDLLKANYAAADGERAAVMRTVQRFLNRAPTPENIAFIKRVEQTYQTMREDNATTKPDGFVKMDYKSVKGANEFIARFNEALIAKESDKTRPLMEEFFEGKMLDDMVAGIEALKEKSNIPKVGSDRFRMQQAIQNLVLFEVSSQDAERAAKRSISGGYVPLGRSGGWQVRIQAVNPETGRVYKIDERYRQRLFYAQVETRAEAERQASEVNAILNPEEGDGLFEMEVLNDQNEYEVSRVKLVARAETARKEVSTTSEANLNEVISTLSRFNVSINPQERENLIVGLTKQNNRARQRLARAGTPGEDPDTLKYVSQHLEATASTVARKHNRHHLDRLFDMKDGDSERLWKGSAEEYARLKAAWENAQKDTSMSEAKRQAIKREYEDYHYTYVTKESPVVGNRFIDRGRRLVGFLEQQTDVDATDFASGPAISRVRTLATLFQMGLSPATAILNYLSLGANVMPALAGRNETNGFGGGFGWAESSTALQKAVGQTAHLRQSDFQYWANLLEEGDAALKAAGFTRAEAEFMRKEVQEGTMLAQLTNALIGSARGRLTSGLAQSTARGIMALFNHSEQHARRAAGLATFRLAYDRAIAEGKSAEDAFQIADTFAVEMIENTLGEYAMFNRPAMFRGGVQQFIFMYKMFPVNMIQMLAALPRREQLIALGILMAFTGMKGLPFAEDMMDIIDTIAQALGLGPRGLWKGSAEKTLLSALEEVAPGAGRIGMRGLANYFTPANISDRMSTGNIIPGTGIFLTGADIGRELIEVGGPVASFLQGAIASSAQLARFALNPSEAAAVDILRKSPMTMMRALGDTFAYSNTGAIVSQKGSVVSEDLHLGVFLTRILGFYPSAAVQENDVVRMNKRLMDYRKDITATFRQRYITARLADDEDAVQGVLDDVERWNEHTAAVGMDIPNFQRSANRALREARLPATVRYLRTVPKNARPETERLMEMLVD